MPSVPIDAVEVREIALPFRTPFVTAYGRLTERRLILVRLRGDGLEGWGECAPVPGYSAETIEGAWDALTGSAASILAGLDSNRPEDAATVVATMGGQTSARAAVEAAVWDLHAKAKGVPLWRGLGGVRDRVPAGAVVDLADPPQALPELVGGLLEAGYLRVKLKISPGDDLGRLEAVRSAFPRADLCADANGAYSEADFDHLAGFDAFDLGYLEQPLAAGDLTGHARLADRITTPICLDESIDGAERARQALASGAARIINLKAARVGGITQALAVHRVAREFEAPLWCGGMLESGIGRAVSVALATLPGVTLPGDLAASDRYWVRDLVDPPWRLEDGHILAPEGPGIGVEIDRDRLSRSTRRRFEAS